MNPFLFGVMMVGVGLGWARMLGEMIADEATRDEMRRDAPRRDGPAFAPAAPPA